MSSHFHDKNALDHVLEKRAEGSTHLLEAHGTEMPGSKAAFFDSLRDTCLALLIVWTIITSLSLSFKSSLLIFSTFTAGWIIWKTGRVALLAWGRLERLHRLIEQEKFEIVTHRPQEREELIALYGSKGFEGKLLDDVVDVLMADQDRLLKVMLEEEMGLTLETHEHPLNEALGAFLGSLASFLISAAFLFATPSLGMILASLLLLGLGSALKAHFEQNRVIAAVIWNFAIAAIAFGSVRLLLTLKL